MAFLGFNKRESQKRGFGGAAFWGQFQDFWWNYDEGRRGGPFLTGKKIKDTTVTHHAISMYTYLTIEWTHQRCWVWRWKCLYCWGLFTLRIVHETLTSLTVIQSIFILHSFAVLIRHHMIDWLIDWLSDSLFVKQRKAHAFTFLFFQSLFTQAFR